MNAVNIFEAEAVRYDRWFDRHHYAYESEVAALRAAMPTGYRHAIEIGSGTGRFASRFGITRGVEPVAAMRTIAETRGVYAVDGVAEALPFDDASCDLLLMVTTICFVDDPEQSCREACRVLEPGGRVVVGLVDRDGFLGKQYEARCEENAFYRNARFFSANEVEALLQQAGFEQLQRWQTIFRHPDEIDVVEPVVSGHGQGGFIVIAGTKVTQ